MEIKEIENKEVWEHFLFNCQAKTFLSSWNWGEFQKMMGNKIWRFGIFEGTELISLALVIKIVARRGIFIFLPHGPNIREQEIKKKKQVLEILLKKLKEVGKKEKASFIRISPIWESNEENNKIFKELGFREAPMHMHPELTWELDITPSEERLLMGLRKTTRYLIRQGEKNKEIEIFKSQKIEAIELFNNLYQKTKERHQFVPFSLNYLKNEFLTFQPDNQILVFWGKYKNKVISSAIILFWSGIGFYHHGASSLKYPKIPLSYLLQWEAIKEARKRGCKLYNFWGIAPISMINNQLSIINPKHPWAGLTLFKMGFGGYKKEYLKTQDFPLSKKYWLTFIFEKLRKTKRGL